MLGCEKSEFDFAKLVAGARQRLVCAPINKRLDGRNPRPALDLTGLHDHRAQMVGDLARRRRVRPRGRATPALLGGARGGPRRNVVQRLAISERVEETDADGKQHKHRRSRQPPRGFPIHCSCVTAQKSSSSYAVFLDSELLQRAPQSRLASGRAPQRASKSSACYGRNPPGCHPSAFRRLARGRTADNSSQHGAQRHS